MSYYPGSLECTLIESLRELLAHEPEPYPIPSNTPEWWNRQEAERNRAETFTRAITNLVRMETSLLETKLQQEQNQRMQLTSRISSLETQITTLQARSNLFDKEQERFMKACVCVTLSREPNSPEQPK